VPGDLGRAGRRRQHRHRRHRRDRALAGLAPRRQRHRPHRQPPVFEGEAWGELEAAAADTLKRVIRPGGAGAAAIEPDWSVEPGLQRMSTFLETKTVWHPKGR
jgi:hypothetical protein